MVGLLPALAPALRSTSHPDTAILAFGVQFFILASVANTPAAYSASKLLISWLYVPFGIMAMLAACFGVSVIFQTVGVSFPASVACLILLFFGLLLSELVLGNHKTKAIVAVIDVPVSILLLSVTAATNSGRLVGPSDGSTSSSRRLLCSCL